MYNISDTRHEKNTSTFFFQGMIRVTKIILTTNYYTRKDDQLSKCRILIPQSLTWVKNTGDCCSVFWEFLLKKDLPGLTVMQHIFDNAV